MLFHCIQMQPEVKWINKPIQRISAMRRIGEAEEMLILLELVTILVAARCKWTVIRLTSVPYNFDIGHVYLSTYI